MKTFTVSLCNRGSSFLSFCKGLDNENKVFKNKSSLHKLIQELIDKGADVNYKDPRGISILLWALRGGDEYIVKLLLAAVANYLLLSEEEKN